MDNEAPQPRSTPGLTACLIVRNDADRLARALASVRGVADAIVVTDTGSTDDSVRVARDAGATVRHFAWCDDFAAAYNDALAGARTEWVLSLDSDETLHPDSAAAVRRLIRDDAAMGYRVVRRDRTDAARPEVYTEMWQLRLFRRRSGTRYVGRIHHQFVPPLDELGRVESRRVLECGVVLDHTGYLGRDWPTKFRRDATLMELELRNRPGQFYYLVELGLTLLRLGDPAGFHHLAEAGQQADDDRRRPGLPRGPFMQLLEWVLAGAGVPADFPIRPDTAERWAETAFADAPPLLWQLAGRAYARGEYDHAAALLDRLIEFGRRGGYDRVAGFDPAILGDDAALNRAACDLQRGRLDAAAAIFKLLADHPRLGSQARSNLDAIRQLRGGQVAPTGVGEGNPNTATASDGQRAADPPPKDHQGDIRS